MRNNNNRNNRSNNSSNNNNGNRRINPRVQTFDSNGPEVRVRGTAYQITEKYVSLARDASSYGDRVLAESYLQHAEHYQRFINEYTEKFEQYNNQMREENAAAAANSTDENSSEEDMSDLDQSFLVGERRQAPQHTAEVAVVQAPVVEISPAQQQNIEAAEINNAGEADKRNVRRRRVVSEA